MKTEPTCCMVLPVHVQHCRYSMAIHCWVKCNLGGHGYDPEPAGLHIWHRKQSVGLQHAQWARPLLRAYKGAHKGSPSVCRTHASCNGDLPHRRKAS